MKLAGATGSELWRYRTPGGARHKGLVLDAAGDVILAAYVNTYVGDPGPHMFVVKLSGVDGTELWRRYLPETWVSALALDSAGDVIGVGETFAEKFLVFKLAGATGGELWRTIIPDGDGRFAGDRGAFGVVVDAADDVIATGSLTPAGSSVDAAIVKLAGASGTELWRYVVTSPRYSFGRFLRPVVDPSGDVIAAGVIVDSEGGLLETDLAVVKVAGNGTLRWLRQLDSLGGYQAYGDGRFGVAVNTTGAVFVGTETDTDFRRFDGGTGGDYLVSNGKLAVRDSAAHPSQRAVKLSVSRATALSQAFFAPGLGDPTGSGAVLQLVNPTTTETATIPLPAARWQPVMGARGLDGYRYEDPDLVDGPCRQVRVYRVRQERTRLRVDCRGDQIPFTLDEPTQGTLSMRLDIGAPSVSLCFTFPQPSDDRSTADGIGLFRAKKSPAPDACP